MRICDNGFPPPEPSKRDQSKSVSGIPHRALDVMIEYYENHLVAGSEPEPITDADVWRPAFVLIPARANGGEIGLEPFAQQIATKAGLSAPEKTLRIVLEGHRSYMAAHASETNVQPGAG